MRDNYRDIAQALARRDTFTGNSMTGIDNGGHYAVLSYRTRILQTDGNGRVVYFDNRFYSITTSRHQSLIRQAFPEATGGRTDRVVYEY
jgi:hypothetical protein